MLKTIQRISKLLRSIIWLIHLLLFCAISIFLIELMSPETISSNDYLLPSLLVFLWSLNAEIIATGFHSIPEQQQDFSWWVRFKTKLLKTAYLILAFAFLLLTAVSLWVSSRLLNI